MRTMRILFWQPNPLHSIIIFQLIRHSSWLPFLLSHSMVGAEVEEEEEKEKEEGAEHLFSMSYLLLLQCTTTLQR